KNLQKFHLLKALQAIPNLSILEPQGYLEFLNLMENSVMIITDSGGVQEESTFLGFLSGGIGYELAIITQSLMGWGTILFAIFLFVVFNMFFFNITQIPALSNLGNQIIDFFGNIQIALPKKKEKAPDITSVLDKVKREVEDEEANKDESETWIVKKVPTKTTAKKEASKPDPDFTIDLPEFKQEPPLPKEVEEKVFAPKEELEIEEPVAAPTPTPLAESEKEDFEDMSFEVEQKEFE
ncbi:MAG: UDP-N-acetylglucosamine 2-epimerase, partial [Bacteroidota bacterium]